MIHAQNILLDLDGTLSDPKEGITKSIAYALTKMGHDAPDLEALSIYIGPPLQDAFITLLQTTDAKKAQEAVAHYRYRYHDLGKGKAENKLYPAIPACLDRLIAQGKRLFVATSKAQYIAEDIVTHFGLAPYFEKIYGAERDGTRNNKADLIAHILETEKLCAKETVMIGDRCHDISGAVKNKVRGLGVLWGYGSAQELREAGATALFATPEELAEQITPSQKPAFSTKAVLGS